MNAPRKTTEKAQREWERGWRIGHRWQDALRHGLCLLIGHDWHVNRRETQRVCRWCWLCQDHVTPTAKGAGHE